MGAVTVVGLGPAGPDLLTAAARRALDDAAHLVVRTRRHPAATGLDGDSMDHHYEHEDSFAAVYRAIVDDLADRADRHGTVTYAVPGSPAVLEETVRLLGTDPRLDVTIVPGMSFLDLAWDRLGIDPVEAGVRLVDGHDVRVSAAGAGGALLVAHTHDRARLSDLKLAFDDDEPERAVVLQRLGSPDESVTEVAWADLDRAVEPDHLTSVFVPAVTNPVGASLLRFDELVRRLRAECPWDRAQTHATLRRHLLEEAYEVLDAIDRLDTDGPGPLEEELGDLLFQVVFHATLGAEAGAFTLGDVATGIHDKLVARHPHVFGDATADGVDGVLANWEQAKAAEKGRASVVDGIPSILPALAYARTVIRKARSAGIDVEAAPAFDVDTVFAHVAAATGDDDPELAVRARAEALADAVRAHEADSDRPAR